MVNRLDIEDRNILEERPNIAFVEPRVMAVPPQPIPEELPRVDAVLDEIKQTKALANAIDVLAAALQGKVDIKAKDMEIDLDPKVDAVVIQAMQRMYPDDESTVITYQQYKTCKDRLLSRGAELADQALQFTDAKAISTARKTASGLAGTSASVSATTAASAAASAATSGIPSGGGGTGAGGAGGAGGTGGAGGLGGVTPTAQATSGGLTTPIAAPNPFYEDYEGTKKAGMYGSKKSKRGGLRPELDPANMVVDAIDIDEFQDCMIKILVNFIWKKFIRPILKTVFNAAVPFSGNALPKKICKCPPGFKVKEMVAKGVPILGEKKPKKQKKPKADPNKVTSQMKGK